MPCNGHRGMIRVENLCRQQGKKIYFTDFLEGMCVLIATLLPQKSRVKIWQTSVQNGYTNQFILTSCTCYGIFKHV